MKAGKGIHSSGRLQADWDNPGDPITLKDDIKLGMGNGSAKNSISEKNGPEKKIISLGGQTRA